MQRQIKRSITIGLFALAVALGVASGVAQNSSALPVEQVADPGGAGGGSGG